ncbi:hypothetical protein V491_00413 [Pseudogymnoascus sp. VKM F-3775]|nr:hypothetical protein V491_00413 [Pseudogymnoascus sp. VKM F-3775]
MLVQWLYVGKVNLHEVISEESIIASLQFIRLADMCRVSGLEELIAERIKGMIVSQAPMKSKKKTATIVHNACLRSEHIMSAVLLPKGYPARTILTLATVPAYLNCENYLSEALDNGDFAVRIATKSFQSNGS